MALSYEFLIARAQQAEQEASLAVLENVRQRALRSEKAWRMMAHQALEIASNREVARQIKSAMQNQPAA